MKYIKWLVASAVLLSPAAAFAQGLYNLAPYDDEADESVPLTWTFGVRVGMDDNTQPYSTEWSNGEEIDSLYVGAHVGANATAISPTTTWDFWGRLGATYYTDDLDSPNIPGGRDQLSPSGQLGVNLTHRASERLRFSSRNYASYAFEPDYDRDIAADRSSGRYVSYSSDNSIGFQWSDRFATITGYRLQGAIFEDLDNNDHMSHNLYNQFRYRVSPTTVLTGEYRYGITDRDSTSTDAKRHYALAGIEHAFSPHTSGILRAGISKNTGGGSSSEPHIEASLKSRMSEEFNIRTFVRYGAQNWNNQVGVPVRNTATGQLVSPGVNYIYDQAKTIKVGLNGEYNLSPQVSFYGGVNYRKVDYEDPLSAGAIALGEQSEDIVSFNLGMGYKLNDNMKLTAGYVYTTASSDFTEVDTNGASTGRKVREYDRNRFNVGVDMTF